MDLADADFETFDILALIRQRFDVADDRVVDARGLRCPQPARRLRKALTNCATGERVAIVADDPLAHIDIPLAATQSGGAVAARCVTGGVAAFLIERSG